MKSEVREKTYSIWLTIDLHKEHFKNVLWVGTLEKMARVTALPITEYNRLRLWREYYCKYSES